MSTRLDAEFIKPMGALLSGFPGLEIIHPGPTAGRDIAIDARAALILAERGIVDLDLVAASGAYVDAGRLWLPWFDEASQVVYSSGRTIHGVEPRWLNPAGKMKPALFATPGAWQSPDVVVVEGPIDALAIAQAGRAAFATAGPPKDEAFRILASKRDVLLVPDADAGGQRWCRRLLENLTRQSRVFVAWPPDGCDPADVSRAATERGDDPVAAVQSLIAGARPVEESEALEGPRRMRFLTLGELFARPRRPELVDGILPSGALAVAYGPSGIGKSFLLLHLCLCVAHGRPFFGHPVRRTGVLYVAAEGLAGIQQRSVAWYDSVEHDESRGVRLHGEPLNLLDGGQVTAFIDAVKDLPHETGLIVIDTFARCLAGGDENAASDVGRAMEAAGRIIAGTGATVVLVHHTGKDGKTERGSTALRGAADTMIPITRRGSTIVVGCDKQKDSVPFEPIHLALAPRADSCILVPAASVPPVLLQSWRMALKALQSQFGSREVPSGEWLRAAAMPNRSFYSAAKALVERGLVEAKGPKSRRAYRLTEAGERAVLQ